MSNCFKNVLTLGGFDRSTSDADRLLKSILQYADANHDTQEADVTANPYTEALRRLRPTFDGIAYQRLADRLAPLAARLDRTP